LINPNAPDFAVIHSTVQKAIDDSEAIDNQAKEPVQAQAGAPTAPSATATTAPSATAKPTPRATPSRSSQTDDLGKVCAA
jgi:hypothetical protein